MLLYLYKVSLHQIGNYILLGCATIFLYFIVKGIVLYGKKITLVLLLNKGM